MVPANSSSNAVNCAIQDGEGIAKTPIPPAGNAATYNFLYCQFTDLSDDQEHNVAIVSADEPHNPFNLDYILYEIPKDSSSSVVPAGSPANVIIDDTRSELIQYEGPWYAPTIDGDFNSTVHGSSTQGSTATFDFGGVRAQVYGTLNPGDDCSSTASYVVDNGPAHFCSNSPQLNGARARQVQLFDSGVLEDKDRTLLVKLEKNASYWLDFIVYTTKATSGSLEPQPDVTPQPSTSPHSPTLSSDPPALSGTPLGNNNSTHAGRNVIIAVVVVVASLCALFSVLLFLFYRRRKRDVQKESRSPGPNGPSPHVRHRNHLESDSASVEARLLWNPNNRTRSRAAESASVGERSSYGPPPDYSSRISDIE